MVVFPKDLQIRANNTGTLELSIMTVITQLSTVKMANNMDWRPNFTPMAKSRNAITNMENKKLKLCSNPISIGLNVK